MFGDSAKQTSRMFFSARRLVVTFVATMKDANSMYGHWTFSYLGCLPPFSGGTRGRNDNIFAEIKRNMLELLVFEGRLQGAAIGHSQGENVERT